MMEQIAPAQASVARVGARRLDLLVGLALALLALAGAWRPLGWAAAGLAGALGPALALSLMLLLPGLALLRLCWPLPLEAAERAVLAVGLSAALPPVLLLLCSLAGLRWSAAACWFTLALSALALLWPRRGAAPPWRALRPPRAGELALLAIFGLTLLVRLYNTDGMPVAPWGDSYHHTVIAQLLVDQGGLFSSWAPYAPLQTFTYHYGFHSNVAWLHWLGGTPATQGVLVIGQVQSALAAPMVYLLARRLLGQERPAIWAALVAGLLSAMPAYYLNWGRFTQLAGQTILPAAAVAWMALLDGALERPLPLGRTARLTALAALLTAGLALTHYRVGVFAGCFVLAYAAYLLAGHARRPAALAQMAGAGLLAGALALLLVTPWLLRLRQSMYLKIGEAFLSSNVGAEHFNALPPLDQVLALYARGEQLALALAGLLVLLWRRRWAALVLPAWAALVWLAAHPYLLGMAGTGILTSFAVLIASYLVLAPLAGAALDALCGATARWLRLPQPAHLALLLGGALACWGLLLQQGRVVTPATQLFTPADQAAVAWVRRATPADAKVFVNGFAAYRDSMYVGSDGGWWLSFLSGRATNVPLANYGTEAGVTPDYKAHVYQENAAIDRHPVGSPEAAAALRAAGYRYLYDGPASTDPDGEYITPAGLAGSPLYEQVYSDGGVTIWRLR